MLRLLERGHSTKQIGQELHLSNETVRNHIRNLLRALGVHSRLEAVAAARHAAWADDRRRGSDVGVSRLQSCTDPEHRRGRGETPERENRVKLGLVRYGRDQDIADTLGQDRE